MYKTCTRCKQEKPTTEFYSNKMTVSFKFSVDYYCKVCRIKSHTTSIKTNNRKCIMEGCGKPHYAKDMCHAHYEKTRRDKERGRPPRSWSKR